MNNMKCSICIASHDKSQYLKKTLDSIFCQSVPFSYEVIIVDDGSPGIETAELCKQYPVRYHRIDRDPGFLNQSRARNISYRMASSDIIISQADDVVHASPNCIISLVNKLTTGHFVIAKVLNTDAMGNPICTSGVTEYTGLTRQKPYFFLGSLYRSDVYKIGGNDEDFMVAPAYEDDWFGDCLTMGLGLSPVYATEIVGHHLDHPRKITEKDVTPSKILYHHKKAMAERGEIPWRSASGPWTEEIT